MGSLLLEEERYDQAALHVSRSPVAAKTAPGSLRDLPDLIPLLGQIQDQLLRLRELGLLSITVLRRDGEANDDDCWEEYESILHEISLFLPRFQNRRMRRSDIVVDPLVSGNTFVVLLDRPRDGRAIDPTDFVPSGTLATQTTRNEDVSTSPTTAFDVSPSPVTRITGVGASGRSHPNWSHVAWAGMATAIERTPGRCGIRPT